MLPEDYPAQAPLPDFAKGYHEEVMRRREGLAVDEVRYGDNPYQSVGIHKSDQANGTVLAFIHGGGWTCGYKEWNDFGAPALTSEGITFVSIGYRLAPDHLFPKGLKDCARAVQWIYQNIAKYGGDADRIFLGGHSAGGHLASLLAIRSDWQSDLGLPIDVLKGCLPVSGVYRFGEGSGLSQRPRFLGEEGNGKDASASSILHVSDATVPFLMAYGENDFQHLLTQAGEMEQTLRDAGSLVTRVILAGCSHLEAHLATGEPDGVWKKEAVKFLAA